MNSSTGGSDPRRASRLIDGGLIAAAHRGDDEGQDGESDSERDGAPDQHSLAPSHGASRFASPRLLTRFSQGEAAGHRRKPEGEEGTVAGISGRLLTSSRFNATLAIWSPARLAPHRNGNGGSFGRSTFPSAR
jgi:hypothetical protein